MAEYSLPELWKAKQNNAPKIGSGGEHEVYSPENGIVHKISIHILRKNLTGAFSNDDVRQELLERQHRHHLLSESFGSQRVLPETSAVARIALGPDDVLQVAPDADMPASNHFRFAYTIETMQPSVHELVPGVVPSRFFVGLGDDKYAEERVIDSRFRDYKIASDALILGKGEMPFFAEPTFDSWMPRSWNNLWDQWEGEAMQELCDGFCRFQKNTQDRGGGEILDMVGQFNFIYYAATKEMPEGEYLLLDALCPSPPMTFDEIRSALLRLNEPDVPSLSFREKTLLLNGCNYIRNVNALMHYNRRPKEQWLQIAPPGIEWRQDIWQRAFQILGQHLRNVRPIRATSSVFNEVS